MKTIMWMVISTVLVQQIIKYLNINSVEDLKNSMSNLKNSMSNFKKHVMPN